MTSGRRVILNFHGIGDPPDHVDKSEAQCWLRESEFLSALDLAREQPCVQITFDDGNASDAASALPALCERDLRAQFFVLAGKVGSPGFLGWEEIRELRRCGMVIGSHGMHHRPWARASESELEEELVTARARIEDEVGAAVEAAACPFGAYNRQVLRALRVAGYRNVYTSDGLPTDAHSWLQPRFSLRRGESGETVRRLLARGAIRPLARLKLLVKKWR